MDFAAKLNLSINNNDIESLTINNMTKLSCYIINSQKGTTSGKYPTIY